MDYQGQGKRPGGTDVRSEPLPLPFHVLQRPPIKPVVVQTCFTDSHYARQPPAFHQVLKRRLGNAFVVGMHAYGSPEVFVTTGQQMHRGKLFKRRTDTQGPAHLGLLHGRANSGQVGSQLGEGQMAVRVGKHGYGGTAAYL